MDDHGTRGYIRPVTRNATPRGRHRLVEPVRRPSLLPRSATAVAATVGAVLALSGQGRPEVLAVRPPQAPPVPAMSALQPVIPAQRDARVPERVAPVDGRALAGVHVTGSAGLRALDAVAATQPVGGTSPEGLFAV